MPIPKPKKGESKQDFVSRCIEFMTVNESEKFPSKEQRAAICYTQWDEYEKAHGRPGETEEEKHGKKKKSQ